MFQIINNNIIMRKIPRKKSEQASLARQSFKTTQQDDLSNLNQIFVVSLLGNKNHSAKQQIIHTFKNKQKKQMTNFIENPFLDRKKQQKNRRKKQPFQKNFSVVDQEFLKVTKLDKRAKTEGCQSLEKDNHDKFSTSVPLPLPQPKTSLQKQQNIPKHKSSAFYSEGVRQYIQELQNSIFHHFPSQFWITSEKTKFRQYNHNEHRTSMPNRRYSFFFPSNGIKTKTERQKPINPYKIVRTTTSTTYVNRNKNQKQKRVFNLDGTLENHKIIIPERRPLTADHKKYRSNENKNKYLSYEAIAINCVKLKRKRDFEAEDKSLKIQPWVTNKEEKNGVELFDLSCSTIREI